MQSLENLKFICNYFTKNSYIVAKSKTSFYSCRLSTLRVHLMTSEEICQKSVTSLPQDLLTIRLLSVVYLVLLKHQISKLFFKSLIQIMETVSDIFLIMNDH